MQTQLFSDLCPGDSVARVTSYNILPGVCPRTLKYNLGPLLKMHAALFDVIRNGAVEVVDVNVGARPTTP